ncbi:MAG: prepilin-type N-terminal cleavage/methylation domain-containing protein [Nitrospirae bacterium]|jgi:prepilin-type N-terminal cleavage/methylation domain-containing protein|nr:prepilin-type N-terminal cleavage/methylation domain-containing protein [Nitrospirota bacterium]
MKNNKGFTLLELIIVLFLITLILGLSLVLFANFLPSNRFKATVRDFSTTIRQARALAQIHGERQIVTIDIDSKKYGIEGRFIKNIPPDIQIKVMDPISGDIHEGRYQFIVHSIGIEGGTVVLWDDKRKASITIDPVVGSLVIR